MGFFIFFNFVVKNMSEDLELPKAVVARIIKASVPEGTTLGKDAKDSIAATAKIFIHHIATLANETCHENKRKNIRESDVQAAITEMGLEDMWEDMAASVEAWKDKQQAKKATRAQDDDEE